MVPLDGSEVADSVLSPAGMPVLVITTGPETPRLTAREKRALRPVSGGVNLFPSRRYSDRESCLIEKGPAKLNLIPIMPEEKRNEIHLQPPAL